MPNEKHEWDNRSNQLNPNNDAYYQSRGWEDKEEYDDYYYDDDDDYWYEWKILKIKFNKIRNDQMK